MSRRQFAGISFFLFTTPMCKSAGNKFVSLLPLNSKLVLLGDSITHMGIYEDSQILKPPAVSVSFTNMGYGNLSNILSGSRFFVPLNGNQGVNGDTVAGALSRVPAVIALKPSVVLLLIGINSIYQNVTQQSIKNDYRSICDKLIESGATVIAPTVLPNFAGMYPSLTQTQETARQDLNSFILSQHDIRSIDVESELQNPAYFLDGLHPNSVGVYILANKVAPILGSLILPGKVQDSINITDNYINNPLFKGTKGSLVDASGVVADGWTLTADNVGGAKVKASKSAQDDKQIVEIDGTFIGNEKHTQLKNVKDTALNIGDVVEGFLEIEILESFNNISALDLVIAGFSTNNSEFVMYGHTFYRSEHSNLQLPVGVYTMRTPPQKLVYPVTSIVAYIDIFFVDASTSLSVSGKFKIHSCSIRKVF